jgi:hypothetical protein
MTAQRCPTHHVASSTNAALPGAEHPNRWPARNVTMCLKTKDTTGSDRDAASPQPNVKYLLRSMLLLVYDANAIHVKRQSALYDDDDGQQSGHPQHKCRRPEPTSRLDLTRTGKWFQFS